MNKIEQQIVTEIFSPRRVGKRTHNSFSFAELTDQLGPGLSKMEHDLTAKLAVVQKWKLKVHTQLQTWPLDVKKAVLGILAKHQPCGLRTTALMNTGGIRERITNHLELIKILRSMPEVSERCSGRRHLVWSIRTPEVKEQPQG